MPVYRDACTHILGLDNDINALSVGKPGAVYLT